MTSSLRARPIVLIGALIALACDRQDDAAVASADSPAPISDPAEAPGTARPGDPPADAPAADAKTPANVPTDAPAPAQTPTPVAAPEPDETFEALARRLGADVPADDDPHKAGFRHLKAGEHEKAQAYFAMAATRDTVAWKHPFNLACAAAKNGDATVARIALVEAVRRDAHAVVAKAERDPDLASVRELEWFGPVLRKEPWPPPVIVAAVDAPADPGTPADAPVPPEPAEPVEPAEPGSAMGHEIPRGTTQAIAKGELAPVLTALAGIHHAKPVVRASLRHAGTGGTAVGWVVYEYSRYESCVGQHADKKAGKKECKRQLGPSPEDDPDATGEMECTSQWLARISPLSSGTIAERTELTAACAMKAVRRLEALDLDADGKDEIVLDVVGAYTNEGFRDGAQTEYGRLLRVLRLDGTAQLQLDTRWTLYEMTPSEEVARRVTMRDADADGHADLVVATRTFAGTGDVDLEDDLWPAGDPDEELLGPITTAVWRYDAGKDAWVEPAKKP